MRRNRGFKVRGNNLVKICKWAVRPMIKLAQNKFFFNSQIKNANPMSKVLNLVRCLRRGAKKLCFPKLGYVPVGDDPIETPKGHLAVYVGESEGDTQRYLVPVIYFNHPLFVKLLEEAEKVYGFNHPGRITLPCGIPEFEKVQTRIALGDNCQRQRNRRKLRLYCRQSW